jgi:hypothetical protein
MPERPFGTDSAGDQQHEEQLNNELNENSPGHNNEQFRGEEDDDDENQSKGDEDDDDEVCFY